MRYLLISLIVTGLLSACGFKGPLYLPERPAARPATAPAPRPAASQPAAKTSASEPVQQAKDANQP